MAVRNPSLTALADCVQTLTNEQFTQFNAVRQNVPTVALEDMTRLQVVVVPATKALKRENRGIATRDYQIELGLFQRLDLVDPDDNALTEDQLIALAEEILEWWVDDQQGVTWIAGDEQIPVECTGGRLGNDEPFDMSTRRTDRVFRCIIQLDFKVI